MYDEVKIGDRRGMTAATGFSEKTNPNRPVRPDSGPDRQMRGEARPFPERCDPANPRRPLTEEQRELVRRYMWFAKKLARQVSCPELDIDELRSEAYEALVDSARLFDPAHGADFSVYARPRIVGALRDYRRFALGVRQKGGAAVSPVLERLQISDETRGRVVGREPEPSPGQEMESLEALESVIRRLPRPQALTCRSIYIEGKSPQEVAAALGYSVGHVSRLHGDALAAIGRHYCAALAG
jgi:RNA polymerase sigma factor (sigma-70 family)